VLWILAQAGVYDTDEARQKALWDAMVAGTYFEDLPSSFQTWRSWLYTDVVELEMLEQVILCQVNRRIFLTSDGKIGKG